MAPVPPFPHECLSCKYGFIWLLFISLSCCGRHEYQNPLHSYKENRPLSPPPTSLLPTEYPDYLPDMACRFTVLFPNALKGKYLMWPTDDVCTLNGFRRKQGFLLVIAMMKSNLSDRTRELREECWLGSLISGYQRWQSSGWQGWCFHPRNLLRPWPNFTKTHSWSCILISSWPSSYVSH